MIDRRTEQMNPDEHYSIAILGMLGELEVKEHLRKIYGEMFSFLGCFSSSFFLDNRMYSISAISVPTTQQHFMISFNHCHLVLVDTHADAWESTLDQIWSDLRNQALINILVVLKTDSTTDTLKENSKTLQEMSLYPTVKFETMYELNDKAIQNVFHSLLLI
jgi:hypothetical protein